MGLKQVAHFMVEKENALSCLLEITWIQWQAFWALLHIFHFMTH